MGKTRVIYLLQHGRSQNTNLAENCNWRAVYKPFDAEEPVGASNAALEEGYNRWIPQRQLRNSRQLPGGRS